LLNSRFICRGAVSYLFKIDLYFFGFDDMMGYMAAKKAKRELDKEALSRVKEEMAEPRIAHSAKGQLAMPVPSARRALRFCWQWR
jgi:hypothetical protein